MNNDVIITVRGVQDGDEKNPIELVTVGKYIFCDNTHRITYEETDLTGMEGTTTTVVIDGKRVTMMRTGSTNTQIILEQGACHMSCYETPYGGFSISVFADSVDAFVGDSFGEISAKYHVKLDGSADIENSFYMKFIST